jgi:hypothetical protein
VKFCPKKWALDKFKGFCLGVGGGWGGGGVQMALNLSPYYEEKLFEVTILKN